MATRTVTVAPSGGDYTSLSAALSGEQSANPDLTSDNGSGEAGILIIEIQGTWSSSDTTRADPTGFTTDATNYLLIRADSSNYVQKDGWDSNRYALVVTDNFAMVIYDQYVRIEGLQIETAYATSNYKPGIGILSIDSGGSDIRIEQCRIRASGVGQENDGIKCYDADATVTIRNCIIEDCGSQGIEIDAGTIDIYNNTIYGCAEGIDVASGSTVVAKNNAIGDCTDDIADSASSTLDYNATDDGDGTNSVSPSGSDWTNEFNDPANGDFTLLNTGNLYDAGVGPGTDSDVPTTDIDGDTRSGSTCDIGADEYVSGDLSFTVSDSVSIAENVSLSGLAIAGLTISVSDTATLTESLIPDQPLGPVSLSDSISIVEALSLLKDILPSVYEEITLAEFVSMLKDIVPDVADTITITEDVALSLVAPLYVDVADAISLSEYVALLKDITPGVSDAISLSEYVVLLRDVLPSAADTITVAEFVDIAGIGVAGNINVSDAISIVESVALLKDVVPSVVDIVAVSENVQVLQEGTAYRAVIVESITLTEYVAVQMLARGIVTASFAGKTPAASFAGKTPEVTFTGS